MQGSLAIYPAHDEWPRALDDVTKAPVCADRIRLVAGARGFDRLSSYKELKALWCFNVDGRKLDSITECESLEQLFIEGLRTENLGSVLRLAGLRVLGLGNCSKVTSLESLAKMHSLQGLAIVNFKNVHDIEPLQNLTSLRSLAVAGGMWARMRVNTLRPLERLCDLELLDLTNLSASDESLRPLAGLRKLQQLDIANFYPMKEVAWLSQRLTKTECGWFKPYHAITYMKCPKCQGGTMLMLTGKTKPTICSVCDEKRLQQHLREWRVAADEA